MGAKVFCSSILPALNFTVNNIQQRALTINGCSVPSLLFSFDLLLSGQLIDKPQGLGRNARGRLVQAPVYSSIPFELS